jgi:hypothetical protein
MIPPAQVYNSGCGGGTAVRCGGHQAQPDQRSAVTLSLHRAGDLGVKKVSRIEMMIVPASIVSIVGYIPPILWTIGLAFLVAGIVVLVAAEKSRHAGRRRYRY